MDLSWENLLNCHLSYLGLKGLISKKALGLYIQDHIIRNIILLLTQFPLNCCIIAVINELYSLSFILCISGAKMSAVPHADPPTSSTRYTVSVLEINSRPVVPDDQKNLPGSQFLVKLRGWLLEE